MENVRFYGDLAVWLSCASAGLAIVVMITTRLAFLRTLAKSVNAGVKSVTDILIGPEEESATAVLQDIKMLQVSLVHFTFVERLRVVWKLGRVFVSLILMTVVGGSTGDTRRELSSERKKLPASQSDDRQDEASD